MKIRKYSLTKYLQALLFKPISTGLVGFAGFFTVVLISKYLGVLVGTIKRWNVDISDVTLSLLGFFLMFLISFLTSLQKFHPGESENNNVC